jgi:hypothetical protein
VGRRRKRRLTVALILKWADVHFARTGAWPAGTSGPVAAAPGDTWRAVDAALQQGHRGLPGGDSLARLLARERGLQDRRGKPGTAAAAARRRRARRLRGQGLTLAEIGRRLGVTSQAVSQMLQKANRDAKAGGVDGKAEADP